MRIEPVFVFDLDGTLVDSLYEHVLAWRKCSMPKGSICPSGGFIARSA